LGYEERRFLRQLVNAGSRANNMELIKTLRKTKYVFTMEEGIKESGFGSAVARIGQAVVRMGCRSNLSSWPRELLLEKYGLSASGWQEAYGIF
jgi:transketolase C-terminal domain/subunit